MITFLDYDGRQIRLTDSGCCDYFQNAPEKQVFRGLNRRYSVCPAVKSHNNHYDERLEHIEQRPEMRGQVERIEETLQQPDEVRLSDQDGSVHLYHRRYPETPVTEKLLLVVVKIDTDSPFVITAFFTDRLKSGTSIPIE